MSGSGSAMFAILHEAAAAKALAERARQQLDPRFWTCVAQNL
jgi:4-diphosphocytidyl-2C-methyl-D-erythritol kinase